MTRKKEITLFKIGQKVRWKKPRKRYDKETMAGFIKEYGDGPFIVDRTQLAEPLPVEVDGVLKPEPWIFRRYGHSPPREHPQLLAVRKLDGQLLLHDGPILRGDVKYFSGKWFVAIKEIAENPEIAERDRQMWADEESGEATRAMERYHELERRSWSPRQELDLSHAF